MKPSERRALEAEKRAQREAETREKEIQKGTSEWKKDDLSNEESPKKEGFFQSHVRIITFSICVVLILTVFGPWAVDRLVDKHRQSIFGTSTENKQDISVKDVIYLAALDDTLTWSDFEKYNYKDLSYEYRDENTKKTKVEYQREYSVDGLLTVKVIGSSLNGRPAIVQLVYYGRDAEILSEIRGEDLTEFLARHGYLK